MIFINYNNVEILCKMIFTYLMFLIISYKLNLDLKISVIIPTFNREKLIGNSIKSVLNQTLKNLEIIVIDDGSTDNTKKEVKKLNDSRIHYVRLVKNTGGANARNVGIGLAKGEYISFQDSDDIFYPNKLEKQLKNIVNKHSDLDFCKINVIYNNSYSYFVPSEIREKRIRNGDYVKELVTYGNFISTQAILVKTSFMKQYLFDPKMPRLQDYDVILRMLPKAKMSYTREVLVDLHIQKNSLTLSPNKLKKAIYLLLKKKLHINEEHKKAFTNYLEYLLKTMFND